MSDSVRGKAKVPRQGLPRTRRSGEKIRCGLRYEREGWRAGYRLIAGVDEVGRGALFGPVLAAAVILDPSQPIRGIQDSKQLPARSRERLADEIRRRALAWALGSADPAEIDRINIYQAARRAMRKAILGLQISPDLELDIPQVPIIRGDAGSSSIAAASILAKVERDSLMTRWDRIFPQYQFACHKGYPTPDHKAKLRLYGPTPLHRYSFAPVSAAARQRLTQSLFSSPDLDSEEAHESPDWSPPN